MNQAETLAAAGAKLRAIREAKGISQEALSLDAEIDQSTLSKVERLGPNVVSWTKLLKVAEALGCLVEVNFTPKA